MFVMIGTSAGNREAELIAALQLLLDRMNSGNVPINHSILEQLQKSGGGDGAGMGLSNVNYTTAGGQVRVLVMGLKNFFCAQLN